MLPRFRQVPVCTNAIITTNEKEHTARPRLGVYLGVAVDFSARFWPRESTFQTSTVAATISLWFSASTEHVPLVDDKASCAKSQPKAGLR